MYDLYDRFRIISLWYDVELGIPTEMKVYRFDFCERECTGLGTGNKAEMPIKRDF